MSELGIIYVLAGVTLVLTIAIGMWQLRRNRAAGRQDQHSGLTEIEEARRKTHH